MTIALLNCVCKRTECVYQNRHYGEEGSGSKLR